MQCCVPSILIKFILEPSPGEENEGSWGKKEVENQQQCRATYISECETLLSLCARFLGWTVFPIDYLHLLNEIPIKKTGNRPARLSVQRLIISYHLQEGFIYPIPGSFMEFCTNPPSSIRVN